ncbi:hypothetical protein JYK22_33715, partial [Nonomuraea sp. RK-328]|nr:hypothetical protein [Nonomuraea sp. RK-328]
MQILDQALHPTVDAYRTREFTTLGRDGTPLTWPTAFHRRADGTLLVTTSLAFAQKALNVRRDGRMAMLLSDPTGSGLTDPPQLLVTGTAVCPEEIVTSPAGDEAYWSMLLVPGPRRRGVPYRRLTSPGRGKARRRGVDGPFGGGVRPRLETGGRYERRPGAGVSGAHQ